MKSHQIKLSKRIIRWPRWTPTNGCSHGRPSTWAGNHLQVPLTDPGPDIPVRGRHFPTGPIPRGCCVEHRRMGAPMVGLQHGLGICFRCPWLTLAPISLGEDVTPRSDQSPGDAALNAEEWALPWLALCAARGSTSGAPDRPSPGAFSGPRTPWDPESEFDPHVTRTLHTRTPAHVNLRPPTPAHNESF